MTLQFEIRSKENKKWAVKKVVRYNIHSADELMQIFSSVLKDVAEFRAFGYSIELTVHETPPIIEITK